MSVRFAVVDGGLIQAHSPDIIVLDADILDDDSPGNQEAVLTLLEQAEEVYEATEEGTLVPIIDACRDWLYENGFCRECGGDGSRRSGHATCLECMGTGRFNPPEADPDEAYELARERALGI